MSSWWHYTGPVTKALVIMGIAAIAILILIAIGPTAPNPISNALTNALHLTRTQIVTKTVYVNRTVTVPVYINRTVYKPIYINTTALTSGFIPYACKGEIWVLNNGTAWVGAVMLMNPAFYDLLGGKMTPINQTRLAYYATGASIFPLTSHISELAAEEGGYNYTLDVIVLNWTVNGYYPTLIYGTYKFNISGNVVITPIGTFPLNSTQVLTIGILGPPSNMFQLVLAYCTFNITGPWLPSQAYYQEIPWIQYYCLGINATIGPLCHTYIGHFVSSIIH